MEKDYPILKRASASRPSSEWSDEDYDVVANGEVIGRIFKANAAPVGSPWMWTFIFPHHEGRTRTHGYEASREAAMAAFAKSWRRGHPHMRRREFIRFINLEILTARPRSVGRGDFDPTECQPEVAIALELGIAPADQTECDE
jgi:hypothetical protein